VSFELTVGIRIPVSGMLRRRAEKAIIDTALRGLKWRAEAAGEVLVTDRRNDGGHLAKLASLVPGASGTARIARSSWRSGTAVSPRCSWASCGLAVLRWVSRRPRHGLPAAARLREHYAQGRLTLEEFHQRLDAVFAATTQSQFSASPATFRPFPRRRRRVSPIAISL